jgi:amino acid transporter
VKYYFRCPSCGNDEEFIRPTEENANLGCGLLVFGGLIPFLLFAEHNRQRVQCARCANIFRQPRTPRTPLARFTGAILCTSFLLTVAAMFFGAFAESPDLLPQLPILSWVERVIVSQPRVTAYLVTLLALVIFLSCWIAAAVSNSRLRKEMSDEYRLKVPSTREIARKAAREVPSETPVRPDDGGGD